MAESATPMAPPVRAVVAIMPAAAPIFSWLTAPRIELWLGALNNAQPTPQSDQRNHDSE